MKLIFIFLKYLPINEKKEIIQDKVELNDCLNLINFCLKRTNIISKGE